MPRKQPEFTIAKFTSGWDMSEDGILFAHRWKRGIGTPYICFRSTRAQLVHDLRKKGFFVDANDGIHRILAATCAH